MNEGLVGRGKNDALGQIHGLLIQSYFQKESKTHAAIVKTTINRRRTSPFHFELENEPSFILEEKICLQKKVKYKLEKNCL